MNSPNPTYEDIINKLLTKTFCTYRWHSRRAGLKGNVYLPGLSQIEIESILDHCNNDFNAFKKLLINNPTYQKWLMSQQNKWFSGLLKARTQRKSYEEKKQKKIKEKQKQKIQRQLQLEIQRKRLKEKEKIAKAKAKRKEALWKQLNLSDDQKKILKQLAT